MKVFFKNRKAYAIHIGLLTACLYFFILTRNMFQYDQNIFELENCFK